KAGILLLLLCVSALAQTNVSKPPPRRAPVFVAPQPGKTAEIEIVSIDGVLSSYLKCTVSGAPVGQVFLAGVPANVKTEYDLMIKLKSLSERESANIKADEKKLRADIA